MSVEPKVGRIALERSTGQLDESSCRRALRAAGFDDDLAASGALDALLASAPADLPVDELLAGSAAAADPARALINASRLVAAPGRPASPVSARELTAFLGASQHMADLLITRPALLASLGRPFEPADAPERYRAAGCRDDAEQALRQAQQVDLLAIAWQDLAGGLDVEQVTILLSCLADAIVSGAAQGLSAERHFAIIALGKLGGLELNYSSDIDLIFVRPDSATDQASADDVARRLLKRVSLNTQDGHLYRVDMRLRPEGSSGALTRTVGSCLDYYRAIGRPWERQMLTKGRVLMEAGGAGDVFLQGTRQWTLDCGFDAGAVRQFKRLKTATENRSAQDERTDVKQAPGGIRDIETIVQFTALMHAAHNPWLLCNSTLHGLERLRVAGALTSLEASRLRRAYLFHRRVENLLQVMHRVQTHRLPVDRRALARLLRMRDVQAFDDALGEHRRRVRQIFGRRFESAFPTTEGPYALVSQLLLEPEPDNEAFAAVLADIGFRQPRACIDVLRRAAAPISRFLPASPRLTSSFANVAPALLERLTLGSEPDAALDRFERMTRGVGAREVLYDQLQHDPQLLEVLCDLADGSPMMAETLTSEPQLLDAFLDALQTGGQGRRHRRERLLHLDGKRGDPWLVLSDHKKLETLRIGVQDLTENAPTPVILSELSHLCIDILRRAYELVHADALAQHGTPLSIKGMSATVQAHMVVVAMGKVGGLEANYGSDADVVFVYSGDGQTDRGVPNSVFFTHVAQAFIARVSGTKGNPRLYKIDTRLRPEGAKGPLVTNLRAFQEYYRSERAALFEHQALLKARAVAGDAALGQRVLGVIRANLRRLVLPDDLHVLMREMRGKIEKLAHGHDLKRGTGGMVDIEQATQYLQLRHAASQPSVLVQETPRALDMLADHSILPRDEARWLKDTYLFFRRVETRLQIALGLDTKEVPGHDDDARRLALRLGYADTAEGDAGHLFLVDLEEASQAIRKRYERIMGG